MLESKRASLEVGDVVQIDPNYAHMAFAACMLVVTELKSWGVQGYVQSLGENRDDMGGSAFIRLKWEEFEFVGRAVWVTGSIAKEATDDNS